MKKIVLLSLALMATAMINATTAGSYEKNARTLPSSINVEKESNVTKYRADAGVKNLRSITNGKVISTTNLKNGSKIEYVKNANGFISKRLVDTRKIQNNLKVSKRDNSVMLNAKATTTTASFFEGFEGWDGLAYDWIPANWQDVSKVGTVAPGKDSGLYNLTWATSDGTMEDPIEGKYSARCQVSVADGEIGAIEVPQDEWLISPSINVKANENLYFYVNYRPGWTLFDAGKYGETGKFEFSAENNRLEVLISKDNGISWTKYWDSLVESKTKTENELLEDLSSYSAEWTFVPIKLKEYEGQNIQVAFRYVGQSGESISVDAVSVNTPTVEASYIRPNGYFYKGYSTGFSSTTANSMLGSAFTESTWYNTSNLESETFLWKYTDPTFATETPLESTDINLTVEYEYAQFNIPSLKASAPGATDSEYAWNAGAKNPGYIQTGGNNNVIFDGDTEETVLGAGNYDIDKRSAAIQVGALGQYAFGTGSDEWWSEGGSDKWAVKAIGNFFDKPDHSYFLTTMWVQGIVVATPDAEFTLTIKKVDETGNIGDVIATSTCLGSDIINTDVGEGTIYSSIPFTFKSVDPITGLEEDIYLTINDAIFVEFSGFKSPKVTAFGPLQQYDSNVDGENNSYVFFDITSTKDGVETTKTKLFPTSGTLSPTRNSAFFFNMDATYTWFETEGDTFNAAIAGESKTFEVNSYYSSEGWSVKEMEDGTLPEWIKISAADGTETSSLTFTVDPLPAGTTGRQADVTVSIPGTDKVFHITQGAVGVEGVKVSAVKVATVGDDFAVTYPATVNSVKIYNVAGQLVETATFAELGNTIIPAQNLAKGMYILKFNDNTTVKAIK